MKTTTDNHIDKLLHEAMKQRADKVPPLADDFADKVLQRAPLLTSPKGTSLTPRPLRGERELKRRRLWPWAGLIAASIVIAFLLWPNSPAVIDDTPVVAEVVEQPAPGAPEAPECSETPEASDKPEPVKPTNSKRTYKVRKAQEKPLLAEAEPRVEENEMEAGDGNHTVERTDPMLLAAAFEQDIRARGERLCQEIIQITTKQ
jgi:hypothetical protein